MFIGRYSSALVSPYSFCLFLAFYNLVNAFPSDRSTLTSFSGLETNFFSEESGFPYLTIGYEEATLEKPKFGFLKFGIPFLKVKELKLVVDLRHTDTSSILKKWQQLASQKTIGYASIEKINLTLIDSSGGKFLITSEKAKFTTSGELRLWNNVVLKKDSNSSKHNKLIIYYKNDSSIRVQFGSDVLHKIS